jgi:hypothetical protein
LSPLIAALPYPPPNDALSRWNGYVVNCRPEAVWLAAVRFMPALQAKNAQDTKQALEEGQVASRIFRPSGIGQPRQDALT